MKLQIRDRQLPEIDQKIGGDSVSELICKLFETMNDLEIKIDPKVKLVFDAYPNAIRKKMMVLRELVIETAQETEGIATIEETLKWGEPSYLTKNGSTLRMDWKPRSPDQYAMYFKCTSRLVETFKKVFSNKFQFESKRAIVFQLKDKIPREELKHCIKATLTYHKVKQLPTLGICNDPNFVCTKKTTLD